MPQPDPVTERFTLPPYAWALSGPPLSWARAMLAWSVNSGDNAGQWKSGEFPRPVSMLEFNVDASLGFGGKLIYCTYVFTPETAVMRNGVNQGMLNLKDHFHTTEDIAVLFHAPGSAVPLIANAGKSAEVVATELLASLRMAFAEVGEL